MYIYLSLSLSIYIYTYIHAYIHVCICAGRDVISRPRPWEGMLGPSFDPAPGEDDAPPQRVVLASSCLFRHYMDVIYPRGDYTFEEPRGYITSI